MTLDEFCQKYDDEFLDMGGSENAKFQCVDEANGHIYYVLGYDPILGTNADYFPSRCLDFCDWYPYQGQYPEAGDLVVWDMGSYGHIASATGVRNGAWFQTFSQNYPLGSPCHYVDFPLVDNITGYLRPRKDTMSIQMNDLVRNVVYTIYNGKLHKPTEAEIAGHAANIMAHINETSNGAALGDWVGMIIGNRMGGGTNLGCPEVQELWMLKADCKADCTEEIQKCAIDLKKQQDVFEKEIKGCEDILDKAKYELDVKDDIIAALNNDLSKCQATQPPTIPVKGNWWAVVKDYFRNWRI